MGKFAYYRCGPFPYFGHWYVHDAKDIDGAGLNVKKKRKEQLPVKVTVTMSAKMSLFQK